jgi:hypothetical protein
MGTSHYGEALDRAHLGLVEPVLAGMAERGISLEINSGGYRKGLGWPFPGPDILSLARQAGVEDVTPGSDCHKPEEAGYKIAECLEVARGAGYKKLAVFTARKKSYLQMDGLMGDVAAGDALAGDVAAGDALAGDAGAGDVAAGDALAGDAGAGNAAGGDASAGRSNADEVPGGDGRDR